MLRREATRLMPDPTFNFDGEAVALARRETDTFFAEILTKNLPLTTFIDPDFTFSTIAFCQRNYGFTPPPPKNVPALTPDTRGAQTPRELLTAHTRESGCAVCHARIDPLGFVLENHDPVGRWRAKWPGTQAAIDPSGTLPDGSGVKAPVEFKAWLLANIDIFSTCLAEKLMTYATGRVPNDAERRESEQLVRANREAGNGFQGLVLDLIDSGTFRAR